MKDEIIEELWNVKDSIAKEHNYNVRSLFERIRERERVSTESVVNLGKERKHPKNVDSHKNAVSAVCEESSSYKTK